jgi:hypothetical protein
MTNTATTAIETFDILGETKSVAPTTHALVEAVTWTEAGAISDAMFHLAYTLAKDSASQQYKEFALAIARKFEGVLNEIALQKGMD